MDFGSFESGKLSLFKNDNYVPNFLQTHQLRVHVACFKKWPISGALPKFTCSGQRNCLVSDFFNFLCQSFLYKVNLPCLEWRPNVSWSPKVALKWFASMPETCQLGRWKNQSGSKTKRWENGILAMFFDSISTGPVAPIDRMRMVWGCQYNWAC